jgi:hypothetical protein
MSNFNFAPGRVKFEKVLIRKRDIASDVTSLVVEVNIYSSLIDPTCIAKVMLIDAKNVLSNLPIESGDFIEATIGYPNTSFVHRFVVSKITNINDYQKQRTYVLECVSAFAFKSFYRNISKAFTGTTSEIAQVIYKETTSEKIATWEPSVGIQNLIVPNWNPLQTLMWLAKRSTSIIDKSRFYFFQDCQQQYHFAPIERFRETYKKNPPVKFTYGKNNQLVKGKPNSANEMLTIKEISFHDSFDFEAQVDKGRFGGLRWQTDLTTKTLDITSFNMWDIFDKNKSLNGNPSWSRIDEASSGLVLFDTVMTNNYPGIKLNKVNDISNIRQSSIDSSQFIDITILGNQTVDVGQVVEIELVSPEPKTIEMRDKFDQRWSGKYYVVAKRDMFNKEEYRTALTLTKESMLTKEVIK